MAQYSVFKVVYRAFFLSKQPYNLHLGSLAYSISDLTEVDAQLSHLANW